MYQMWFSFHCDLKWCSIQETLWQTTFIKRYHVKAEASKRGNSVYHPSFWKKDGVKIDDVDVFKLNM